MKKSTKVLIVIFFVAAITLYLVIYGVPSMKSMLKKTTVLEYGSLSVFDEVEACFVRDETLYVAATAGTIEYKVEEGAKVRGGVSLLNIIPGAPPPSDTDGGNEADANGANGGNENGAAGAGDESEAGASGTAGENATGANGGNAADAAGTDSGNADGANDGNETDANGANGESANGADGESANGASGALSVLVRVLSKAGASAEVTPDNAAPFTAMVSYFADGYEKILSPASIDTLTEASANEVPAECVSLSRTYAGQGEPIYKLTDNNLWYMVYWVDRASFVEDDPENKKDDPDGYTVGKSVNVSLGSAEITAVIHSYTPEGSRMKVVLRSDMYYKDMQKYRKMKIKVIFAEHRGLLVDDAHIVAKDGTPGVFVKRVSGDFRWTPIHYIKTVDDKHIVSVGAFDDDKGDSTQTVQYYDEILIEPETQGYS